MRGKLYNGLFPNLRNDIAYYSPIGMAVKFETLTEKDCRKVLSKTKDYNDAKNKGIIFHEVRHSIDHLSTLWGQKNILSLYEALNVRLKLDISAFDKVILYCKQLHQLHFAQYYTEHSNSYVWQSPTDIWHWQPTVGFRCSDQGKFDFNSPILFIRFMGRGKSIVRVPLSIASLLETNAMKEEVLVRDSYVASLSGHIHMLEDNKMKQWMMRDWIYSSPLAVYNVAAHATANLLGLSAVKDTMIISSAVATLALNLPSSVVTALPIKLDQEPWGTNPQLMLNNHDYGFIFYNLLNNYKPIFLEKKKFSLDDLLIANQLPNQIELKKQIRAEIETLHEKYNDENVSELFTEIASRGLSIFDARSIDGSGMDLQEILEGENSLKPFMIYKNTKTISNYGDLRFIMEHRPINNISATDFFCLAELMDMKMEEFYNVRGL